MAKKPPLVATKSDSLLARGVFNIRKRETQAAAKALEEQGKMSPAEMYALRANASPKRGLQADFNRKTTLAKQDTTYVKALSDVMEDKKIPSPNNPDVQRAKLAFLKKTGKK